MKTIEICLPIKNEEKIIATKVKFLDKTLSDINLGFNWIISGVVNGSQDSSYNVLENLRLDLTHELKLFNIKKGGKARAIKTCWQESEADILVFMDIDLAVPPNFLKPLVTPLINKDAELVIGSRFLPESEMTRSWQRRLVSWLYITLSSILIRHKQSDLQCGFKAITKRAYKQIVHYLKDDNWFLDTELIMFTQMHGMKIKEIPVKWQEREGLVKKSNIRVIRDGWHFFKNLINLRRRLKKIEKK